MARTISRLLNNIVLVTDLALQAYQLLRQDLQELINEMEEVELWDEG